MRFVKGNLFDCNAEALVNTVNIVGVMGKGIALQFKELFPKNYELYAAACKKGKVQIGKMFITTTNNMVNPQWIINFPTKKHWINQSSYTYIEVGLDDLIKQIYKLNIQSIAIPPLGTGQGGLKWEKVKQLIISKLGACAIDVTIFEPDADVKPEPIKEKTKLTKPRALILSLINQYRKLGYDISLLEIQKLAYFLQRMGQKDLKLHYKKYFYGPYAHNLYHLLHELEKGYISTERTVFDAKPLDLITLNIKTLNEIEQYIEDNCNSVEKNRLEKIKQLMSGFETPFGLELLSSVDWVIEEAKNRTLTIEEVKKCLEKWTRRKGRLFDLNHINSARLKLNKFHKELAYV